MYVCGLHNTSLASWGCESERRLLASQSATVGNREKVERLRERDICGSLYTGKNSMVSTILAVF